MPSMFSQFPIFFVGVMIRGASASQENSLLLDAFDLSVLSNTSHLDRMRSETKFMCGQHLMNDTTSTKIPRYIWIAVKDNASSFLKWPNIKSEIELNPSWSVHICDDDAEDSFMEKFFPNTSLLSSYRNINTNIAGASKADIWRYAVLYVFGGVYVDSDSQLTRPLDEVIMPTDDMIVAFEKNRFDGDWCYNPHSEFSSKSIITKYPFADKIGFFKGRIITNWCIMTAPRHLFLGSALRNFVKLSKVEFLHLSNLKISLWDPFSKYVYCSTGPYMLTTSARKAIIEGLHNNGSFNSLGPPIESTLPDGDGKEISSYRLASKDFGHEGGVFKAIRNTKSDANHYTQIFPTKVSLVRNLLTITK